MDDLTYRKCVTVLTRIRDELEVTLRNAEANRAKQQASKKAA